MKVDPDKFLTELNKLYERAKTSGSVYVTMKRTNEKARKSKKDVSEREFKCLVRASDGGKHKFSALLTKKELARFKDSFDTILKAHMDSLKKRERKPKK